ncbi:hypothetical protein [Deinococcus multiflagellatus]|uniref:Uncharacterized protein n=1 Tax=Deinococcus multiflagellatus TaxID=1656887 RepID=A0ABW1ZT26_9DEIO|nr:hypothetical protein [Deinococcus multiflagellatus]MBZ9714399.1 hypothetical protein [Deinococcus multiflagellatus]
MQSSDSLLTVLRGLGVSESEIEQTLHSMGSVTDPHDPNATPDPLDYAVQNGLSKLPA